MRTRDALSEMREELAWLLRHPIGATSWWFRHLVIQRLNGERAAAKQYEAMIRMTPEDIAESRRRAEEMGLPRRQVKITTDRYEDWYEHAEFACPHCGTELVAPWQPCPKCEKNNEAKE